MKKFDGRVLVQKLINAITRRKQGTILKVTDDGSIWIKVETNPQKVLERFGKSIVPGAILWDQSKERDGDLLGAGLKVFGYDTGSGKLYFHYFDELNLQIKITDGNYNLYGCEDIGAQNLEIYQDVRQVYITDAGTELSICCNPKRFYERFGFRLLSKFRLNAFKSVYAVGFVWDSRSEFLDGRLVYQNDISGWTNPVKSTFKDIVPIKTKRDFLISGFRVVDEPTQAWLKP